MGHTHHHDTTHDHADGEQHEHPFRSGIISTLGAALHLPGFGHDHSHDYTDRVADHALDDNNLGIRTVWLALIVLGLTTVLQIAIYVIGGSVALLADTVHNLGDALNSLPLLVAFYIARRAATRRYTYGYGRAEDLAGILIVISIAFSAGYILIESVQKLFNPQPLTNLPWIAAAAVIGFIGNELVAVMQIRVGEQIGSHAMIADGQHARVDGLTSLSVLIAVAGAWIGIPILDPIVGIIIAFAIVGITWNAIKTVWYRLMDAVDPHIMEHMEHHVESVSGVKQVRQLRAHWVGHRLNVEVTVAMDAGLSLAESYAINQLIRHEIQHAVRQLGELTIEAQPVTKLDNASS
nr:cation transporter [Anaerolineae bacterium]